MEWDMVVILYMALCIITAAVVVHNCFRHLNQLTKQDTHSEHGRGPTFRFKKGARALNIAFLEPFIGLRMGSGRISWTTESDSRTKQQHHIQKNT